MDFSRTSFTNLGLGFSRSNVKQSALYNDNKKKWSIKPADTEYPQFQLISFTHQSSQLHRNWKLLKWWENQLMSLEPRSEPG